MKFEIVASARGWEEGGDKTALESIEALETKNDLKLFPLLLHAECAEVGEKLARGKIGGDNISLH